jgi:CheY-like chemotaxis protein
MLRPGITVVIVEDHPETRFFLTQFLNRQGAKVIATANAFDGLRAVQEHRPDIVLSDLDIPDRDGIELLRDIRALGPKNGGDVPVVAMTSYGLILDRRVATAGFQSLLNKPFGPHRLLEVITPIVQD